MAEFYNMPVRMMLGKTDREINPRQDEAVAFRRDDLEVMNSLQEKIIPEESNTNAQGERRYMWTVKRPIVGPDGQATHVLGVSTDITDRKRAEDKLRDSEQRYRQLFNSGSDAVFVYRFTPEGLPGELIEVNDVACQRLGFSREKLMAMTILDINLAADHPQILADCQKLQRDKRSIVKRTHVTRDGGLIPVEVSCHLFNLAGQPAILTVARDISEREKAEAERGRLLAQLLQAQKMEAIGRLTGGIAHDFNNILTAINGYAEMLRSGLGVTDPSRIQADKILDAVEQAAGLVRQLLSFGHKGPARPQVLDINRLLGQMEGSLHRVAGNDVRLVFGLADRVWPVSLDPTQLEQVVFSLVVNAREALPTGGLIHIQTRNVTLDESDLTGNPHAAPGEFVQVNIRDTGVGMSDEVKSHLFEPFFTTKQENESAGLGLATVYGIISQNGGHIQVGSTEGQGTTFHIFFPRVEGDARVSTPTIEPVESQVAAGAEAILLVEDNDDVRRMIRRMLEGKGYSVLEAANAETARTLCTQHTGAVQLLLADVVLPDTHGPQLADELCRQQPDLKTLFISGYASSEIEHFGWLKPGSAFVKKPFTPAQLLDKVREVLDA